MKYACMSLAFLLTLVPAALGVEYTGESPQEVAANLKSKKALLIDVREDAEWKTGHVLGAMSVPLSFLEKGAETPVFGEVLAQQMPKDRVLYIYCASGERSLKAAGVLTKLGWETRPLKAGFQDIVAAGFPVYKPQPK